MKININDYVSVVLTDIGAEIWNANEMRYEGLYKGWEPRLVSEGDTSKIPLWKAMNIFGPHMGLGQRVPFEECGMIILEEDK